MGISVYRYNQGLENMEFQNETPFPALHFESIDQHGGHFHVVVVRRSYEITAHGLVPCADQQPICDTDQHEGDDPRQGTRQESDLCPFKPRCDVLVNAVAHAPAGKPTRRFKVRLLVESKLPHLGPPVESSGSVSPAGPLIDKSLVVCGPRHLRKRRLPDRALISMIRWLTFGIVAIPPWRLSKPELFTAAPVAYKTAYGGDCRIEPIPGRQEQQARKIGRANCLSFEQSNLHPDTLRGGSAPLAHSTCEQNPLGAGYATGWYLAEASAAKNKIPAPQIELDGQPFTASEFWRAVRGNHVPAIAGLSAVGRTWLPRRALIGKFENKVNWSEDETPEMPVDFDYGYWNCAPVDQQCEHLSGNETITLVNLSTSTEVDPFPVLRDNVLKFDLPGTTPFITLIDEANRVGAKLCSLDTVYVEPEIARVALVWRVSVPTTAMISDIRLRIATTEEAGVRLAALIGLQELTDSLDPEVHEEVGDVA